jgi:hypothetical protein
LGERILQGNLTETNVADLVVRFHLERRSGILRLSQSEIKKSIYFKDGKIVFAHSNLKNERLGEVFLRLGKITEDEFRMVSSELEKGRRLGQILYEKGFLSPSEINAGVSYQIQQILFSVFNWDSGEFEFIDRERPVFEDIIVEVSTPLLVIDGIRNITNLVVLERAVGNYEDQVVRSCEKQRLPRTNLDFSEDTILACVDNKATLRQLRGITRLASHEFGRAVYCLMICGMIRFDNSPAAMMIVDDTKDQKQWRGDPFSTQEMPDRPVPQLQPAVAPKKQKTYTEGEMRDLIQASSLRFLDATDEEVLGVLPDATRDEIQKAFDQMTEIFHPPYYSADRFRDLKEPLKAIIDRLQESLHNLLERDAMRQPLVEGIPDSSFGSIASVKLPPAEPLPELNVPQPGPIPVSDVKQSTLLEPNEIIPEQAVGEQIVETPAVNPATDSLKEQTRSLAALQESIRMEPVNTALYRELGKKLQQGGKAREAEQSLLRALEIEPRNVENHFSLADFYQAQGLKFKAFKHLNIVLQLDPENKKALELLGVKKRKSALYDIRAHQ